MQFFGARVNLAKTLLYAINGGRDEITGKQVAPGHRAGRPATSSTTTTSLPRFDAMMDWLAETYVDALNFIHYMHDKYAYERLEMALHDHAGPAHHGLRHRRPVGRRRLAVGDQVRHGHAGARRDRPGRRLRQSTATSRRTATTTTAPTTSRSTSSSAFMAKVRQHPTYRGRRAHPVGADDHLERRLRQGHRQHPGRPARRRAVRPGRQPDERPRPARHASPRRCRSPSCPTTQAQDGISLTSDRGARPASARTRDGAGRQPRRHPRRATSAPTAST